LLVLMVIFLRNPIHALLCFIFAVINILSIFITLQAEFVAIILFLVYVGAIAVLFLALIMFLNLSYLFYNEINTKTMFNDILEKILLFVFIIILYAGIQNQLTIFYIPNTQISNITLNFLEISNIAFIMYDYFYFFIILSGILLYLTTIVTMVYTTLPKVLNYKFNKELIHTKIIENKFYI
jgi:NADH-quinone oxidoreductase subunit J